MKTVWYTSFMVLVISTMASAQTFHSGYGFSGTQSQGIYQVVQDHDEFYFTCGESQGNTDIDPSSGYSGANFKQFLARYGYNDSLHWAIKVGSNGAVNPIYDLEMDDSGYLYWSGMLGSGDQDFNPYGTPMLENMDFNTGFLAKYDTLGIAQWVVPIRGKTSEMASDLSVDASQNIVIAGQLGDSTVLDPSAPNNYTLCNGSYDPMLAKYDPAGNLLWGFALSNDNGAFIHGLETDGNDNIYITGMHIGITEFNPLGVSTVMNTNNEARGFLAKYNSNGVLLWLKDYLVSDYSSCWEIAIFKDRLMLAISYEGTLNIDPGATNATITSTGGNDNLCYLQLDTAGNYQWHIDLKMYPSNQQTDFPIEFDAGGNAIVGGGYWEGTDIDPGPGVVQLPNPSFNDATDIFVISYSLSGQLNWWFTLDGTGNENVYALDIGRDSMLMASGVFWDDIDLDPGTGTNNINASHLSDAFFGRYVVPCASSIVCEQVSVCAGSSYTFPDGHVENNITTPISYTSTLAGAVCDSLIFTEVTVGPGIDTTVSMAGNVLTAQATGVSYQWINCGTGQPVNGETNQTFTLPASGFYAVVVSDGNCSDTSACYGAVGVANYWERAQQVTVYPNPGNGNFIVAGVQINAIEVFDVLGKVVYAKTFIDAAQHQINLTHQQKGVYLMKVWQGEKISVKRLVIE